jgi:CheY-like chemotaxis protein
MKAQKHTLLVVDDDADQRFLAEITFQRLGAKYKIQVASSGNEAIAYFKGEGQFADRNKFEFPSFVVTDLKMPDGDGFHVLEFLKENPALSLIPVVMISSSDDADDIRQAYLLGASSYMVKPSSLDGLEGMFRRIHEYWADCEVPEVDVDGYAVATSSKGRLGARYTKPQR